MSEFTDAIIDKLFEERGEEIDAAIDVIIDDVVYDVVREVLGEVYQDAVDRLVVVAEEATISHDVDAVVRDVHAGALEYVRSAAHYLVAILAPLIVTPTKEDLRKHVGRLRDKKEE